MKEHKIDCATNSIGQIDEASEIGCTCKPNLTEQQARSNGNAGYKETGGRSEVTENEILFSTTSIREHLASVIEEKGNRSFASIHEILGVIDEEFEELKEAIHGNDYQFIHNELLDLGAMAIFALASLQNRKLDW